MWVGMLKGRVSEAWRALPWAQPSEQLDPIPAYPASSVCEVHPSCSSSSCFSPSWFFVCLFGFVFSGDWVCKNHREDLHDFRLHWKLSPGDFFSLHGSPHLRLHHECHWASQGSPLKLIIKDKMEGFKTDASKTQLNFINAPCAPSTSIRNFVIYTKVH